MRDRRASPASSLVPRSGPLGRVLALALAFSLAGTAAAQASGSGGATLPGSGAVDLVLLIDDSASVLQWSRDVNDFLLGPFVRDYLRLGDTIHLLSFGSSTNLDMVRKLGDEGDLKAILGQLFLLYPIRQHTDFIGALDFLGNYVRSLDPTRKKLIVIVTDGVQDPPLGSRLVSLDAKAVAKEIDRAAKSLRELGWPLRFVMLPFGNDALGRPASEAQPTGTPSPSPASPTPMQSPASPTPMQSPASPRSAISDANGGQAKEGAGAGLAGNPEMAQGKGIATAEEAARALNATVTHWPPAEAGPGAEGGPSDARAQVKGSSSAISSSTAAADFGFPSLEFPGNLGSKGRSFTLPLLVHNKTSRAISLDLVSIDSSAGNLLVGKAVATVAPGASVHLMPKIRLPKTLGPGAVELAVQLKFADDERTMPGGGTLSLRLVESPIAGLLGSLGALGALGLLAFFVLALVIFRLLGWLPAKAKRVAGRALSRVSATVVASALPKGKAAAPTVYLPSARAAVPLGAPRTEPSRMEPERFAAVSPSIKRMGQIKIEFRVLEQNSHIGKRNVHELHAGQAKSIGGKRSDFLIFLVPMPHAVAELHFDGEACSLVPRDPRLFPGLEGPIPDCLERDIPMLSPRGYPLTLRFVRWEDPGLRLNRLLHCIEVPGLDWDRGPAKSTDAPASPPQ